MIGVYVFNIWSTEDRWSKSNLLNQNMLLLLLSFYFFGWGF